jgi:argininosuccinate synthase
MTGAASSRPRCVLAYSGGLDTSVAIPWMNENLGYDVVALSIDLGEARELEAVQRRALATGAVAAYVVDARRLFVENFAFPSLMAGALYEGVYPLATALGRPLIAKLLVDLAREEGAVAVAHGCTGKGNDQVRFDVATAALAPELAVVAPVRDWEMGRPDEIRYAQEHGIEVPATAEQPYSIDANLWGRSIETGTLEDPWAEPPRDVFAWTVDAEEAPSGGVLVELGFEHGRPVSIDGERSAAE